MAKQEQTEAKKLGKSKSGSHGQMEGGARAERSGDAEPEKKVAEGTAEDPERGSFKEGHKQKNLKVPAWVCNKPLGR